MNKPLHRVIANRIDESGLSQREIAAALGYSRSNVVAMIKAGEMRVPIAKIPALADILAMDRVELLRAAMAEYQPEVLETINQIIREPVPENERRLLAELRRMIGGPVPPLATARQRERLKALAEALAERVQETPLAQRRSNEPMTRGEDYGSWGDPQDE
jgi:transcriptional regulator with XRE-family HTH domain